MSDKKGWDVYFYGQREEKPYSIISAMKVSKLLRQGYDGYWGYAMDIQEKEETTENILVMCEFKDVFPK